MVEGIRHIHLLAATLMLGVLVAFFLAVLSSGVKARAQETTGDPVLVGAGDIAGCSTLSDEATAELLAGIGGTVFTLGDNAYETGTSAEFANCYDNYSLLDGAPYDPSRSAWWGQYKTARASGYFGYFGSAAGDPSKGYYSYERGAWHVVVLNSNCSKLKQIAQDGCTATSPQVQWLKADLAAHPSACTLAYWHHPRFSSSQTSTPLAAFWNALYKARAEVVLNGHMHNYERFAEQTPGGVAKAGRGIREFVVGTGGRQFHAFPRVAANSEARNATAYGVLKLTLHASSYEWEFVPVAGQSFPDSGTTNCH